MTPTQQHIRDEINRADSYRAADTDPIDTRDEILTSWILVIGSATREMRRALVECEDLRAKAQRYASGHGALGCQHAARLTGRANQQLTRFAEYQRLAFLAAALSVGDDNPFFVVQS